MWSNFHLCLTNSYKILSKIYYLCCSQENFCQNLFEISKRTTPSTRLVPSSLLSENSLLLYLQSNIHIADKTSSAFEQLDFFNLGSHWKKFGNFLGLLMFQPQPSQTYGLIFAQPFRSMQKPKNQKMLKCDFWNRVAKTIVFYLLFSS